MERAILAARALGDPLALRLLFALLKRDHTMAQFRAMASLGRSAINVRLEKLRAAGLVDADRDQQKLRFMITPAGRALATTLREVYGDELAWDPSLAFDATHD